MLMLKFVFVLSGKVIVVCLLTRCHAFCPRLSGLILSPRRARCKHWVSPWCYIPIFPGISGLNCARQHNLTTAIYRSLMPNIGFKFSYFRDRGFNPSFYYTQSPVVNLTMCKYSACQFIRPKKDWVGYSEYCSQSKQCIVSRQQNLYPFVSDRGLRFCLTFWSKNSILFRP